MLKIPRKEEGKEGKRKEGKKMKEGKEWNGERRKRDKMGPHVGKEEESVLEET